MITYHMMGVTAMIIVQLLLLKLIKRENAPAEIKSQEFVLRSVGFVGIVLMLIQIILGTQVRQQTDVMFKAGVLRENIALGFDWVFFVHRSFSFLIIFSIIYLLFKLYKTERFKKPLIYLVLLTGMEVLVGIILYYFNLQAFAQPIHLLLSILIFAFFVEIFLRFFPRL
jgi:heme a synthase